MPRISMVSWIALAAAATVAFVVILLGHGGGRESSAERIPDAAPKRAEAAPSRSAPGPADVVEGVIHAPDGVARSGRVVAIPTWPVDPFAVPVATDVQPDGSFRVGPLVRAAHSIEIDLDGAAPVLVADTHVGERIEATAEPGVAVTGCVRTSDGVPIPRASVWALFPPPFSGRRLAVCDAEGRFRLPGMPPGRVHLYAEAERFAPGLDAIDVPAPTPGVADSIRHDVLVGRGTDLVGLVRSSETGLPLPDAIVLVWKFAPPYLCETSESLLLQRTRTGADGFFRLPKLPAARACGWVTAEGRAPVPFDVPLAADWRAERLDVDLPAGGTATVRLVGEKGEPKADVDVDAIANVTAPSSEPPLPRELRLGARRRSDTTGKCTFEDLRADRWVYFALPERSTFVPRYCGESFWPIAGQRVACPDFAIREGGRILARIALPGDRSASFARVRCAGRGFLADDAGVVRVDGIEGSSAVVEIDHPLAAPATVVASLGSAKDVSGLRWHVDAGAELSGRILESGSGEPLSAAVVSVSGTSPFEWTRTAHSEADGAFRVVGLGPSPWTASVSARGHAARSESIATSPPAPITLSLDVDRRSP
jgi:carboxypeptidase family protein